MLKKILSNLVISLTASVLFIGSSYACSVYNNTQDPGQTTDLLAINTALLSANPNDVIEFSGTCTEAVVINIEGITLQGNVGKILVPLPKFRNNGISIFSKFVIVKGKTAKSDLRIDLTRYGILVALGATAVIDNVIVSRSFGAGIHVRDGAHADIKNVNVTGSTPTFGTWTANIGDFDQGGYGDEGSGITVTRNGGALIRNASIWNNADIGIDVHGAGLAEIKNVTVTGNDYGITSEAGSTILVENSTISTNSSWGIELFATDANVIGAEDGSPGDVLVQNNGSGGISIVDSHTEMFNTTVSGNGGAYAVNVFSSSIGLFGGNSITHDGTANGSVCAYNQGGPAAFTAGAGDGSSDSITVANDTGDDTALCVTGSSEFHHDNVTINGGSNSLGAAIFANAHSDTQLSENVSGTTSVTGNVNTGAYALLTLNPGTTLAGDITADNATGTVTFGTVTGNVTLYNDAKLFHGGSISGSLTCSGLTSQAGNFGGTIGSLSSDTTAHSSCTGVFP